MEFFRIIEIETTETKIQDMLPLDKLQSMTNLLFPIGDMDGSTINIGGLWGEFTLVRSEIKGGLRFVLEQCPNALAWTITTGYPPAPKSIVVHLTINRSEKDPEFVDDIESFLNDHRVCLHAFFEEYLNAELQ